MDYRRYRRAGTHVWALFALLALDWLAGLAACLLPESSPAAVRAGLLSLILPFGYSAVLFTLYRWNPRFALAGGCALAAAAMAVLLGFTDEFSARTAAAVSIAFLFMGALDEYFECSAQGNALAFIDYSLRRRWGRLWTWYIWTLAAVILGRVAGGLLPSAGPAIEAVLDILVLAQRAGKAVLLALTARMLRRRS